MTKKTQLLKAIEQHDTKKVQELLKEKGADVNVKLSGCIIHKTFLHHAARNGYQDIVKVLLDAGANVNAKDIGGYTALHEASFTDPLTNKALLDAGANVNAKDIYSQTALHLAAMLGSREIAEVLLDAGADVNAKNRKGNTPVQVAAENGRTDLVTLLGGRPNKRKRTGRQVFSDFTAAAADDKNNSGPTVPAFASTSSSSRSNQR